MKAFQEQKSIKFTSVLLAAALLVLSGCGSFTRQENASNTQQQIPPAPIVVDGVRTSYADVVEKTSPAVVRIDAERKSKQQPQQFPFADNPFFKDMIPPQMKQQQRPQIERGLGSGVVISADGTVLTNHHVIDGADKITVTLDNNKIYDAKIVGSDAPSDLAVLKIEAENLPFLSLGNSDGVRIGDIVLAIGNPLGIGKTVTAGIISAKGRRTGLSDGSFEDFLQTDAPINRGNSGGALVNLAGELIGINSQIISDSGGGGNIGIGFSIPSNMAKSVMEQLLKDGKVHRGMLGVNIQNITEEVAKSLDLKDVKGVIVSNVKTGSSADKAGIKRGDIITAINGEAIEDSNVLRNKVAGSAPGTDIKVSVLRDGKQADFTAKLDEFNLEGAKSEKPGQDNEESPGSQKESGKLGLNLQPVTPQIAKQLDLPSDTEGLVVMDVDPEGASAEEGIAQGDVILEINRQPVKTLDDVSAALDKSGNRPVLLLVTRKGSTVYLTVTPKQ
ncbi:MAG TPA: Do family serine endopeptidase [Pyrinomonadaceae bacterium]|jgi:Do/DeqQ family serine protease